MYCTKCKKDKIEESFRERKSLKRGRQSWCKECESEASMVRYIPKPRKTRTIKPYDAHNALVRMLKSRYNMSYDDYKKLYDSQDGKCAICKTPKPFRTQKGLYIDHNHETKRVRGLLCTNCNSAIGKFKESEELLKNAIVYLNSQFI
jgi:hypothetical protein